MVGPRSMRRLQLAYQSVDDIDLFVGGLAERPVGGGLVGPVFACIIAQQFSNLRKGDRFWYENGGFESSFTPAQLQSIRQVSLSQVVCRSLGGGTMQPHIFLPHTVSTNDRIPCGSGSMAPIDLKPWLERDPFTKDLHQADKKKAQNKTTGLDEDRGTRAPLVIPVSPNASILTKLDFPKLNASHTKQDHRKHQAQGPVFVSGMTVNNKLDMGNDRDRFRRPPNRVSNKIHLTTERNKTKKRATRAPSRKKKRKTETLRHRAQRDVTKADAEQARSTIYIKIDKTNDHAKTPFSHEKYPDVDKGVRIPDKEYVILTPDQNSYDIEIKIKPSTAAAAPAAEKVIVHSNVSPNKPSYGSAEPEHDESPPNGYRPQSTYADATEKPFYGIITKRPSPSNPYGSVDSDEVTAKPYYTTKRPANHASNDDNRPFYNYPTVQQTDQSSYYTSGQNDAPASSDNYPTPNTMKPYYSVPLYQSHDKPQSGYGSTANDDDSHRPMYSYRPPLAYHTSKPVHESSDDSGYGDNVPLYLDDSTTRKPRPHVTTYSYSDSGLQDSFDSPYGQPARPTPHRTTTYRPHDLMTFYTVMTTRRRKRTRPTPPMNYNQQDSADDEDDDDDDAVYDFSPTSVLTNIVSTFSDYFGPQSTTTRRPYISYQDSDHYNDDNFYTYPTYGQHDDSSYARERDNKTDRRNRTKPIQKRIDYDDDYEMVTFRPALNVQYNQDDSDDDDGMIAFDRDGYLRPEYSNYMRPNGSEANTDKEPTALDKKTKPRTGRQMQINQVKSNRVKIVPITVLTTPER